MRKCLYLSVMKSNIVYHYMIPRKACGDSISFKGFDGFPLNRSISTCYSDQ